MAQQRPMSTPIFDELLREFTKRMEEPREREEPPTVPQPSSSPPAQNPQTTAHRHRAD
jgi:hypothetical protein